MKKHILTMTQNFATDGRALVFNKLPEAISFMDKDIEAEIKVTEDESEYTPAVFRHTDTDVTLMYGEGDLDREKDAIFYNIFEIEVFEDPAAAKGYMRQDRLYKSLPLGDFVEQCNLIFSYGGFYLGGVIQNFNYLRKHDPSFIDVSEDELKQKFISLAFEELKNAPTVEITKFESDKYYTLWSKVWQV